MAFVSRLLSLTVDTFFDPTPFFKNDRTVSGEGRARSAPPKYTRGVPMRLQRRVEARRMGELWELLERQRQELRQMSKDLLTVAAQTLEESQRTQDVALKCPLAPLASDIPELLDELSRTLPSLTGVDKGPIDIREGSAGNVWLGRERYVLRLMKDMTEKCAYLAKLEKAAEKQRGGAGVCRDICYGVNHYGQRIHGRPGWCSLWP
ncbi:unnamed protein product [Vitrella brassicaformis CCMP3155]|uniref:Uncharacterized protein n=2 Tax=Vitrella brassicaformis TaxID=1169539 RepID=A0A0G4FGC4_VITBC|nr:unnamed protein product [Vitrella brassicaformis CCMP3155]|eukprot:CEM12114.1 unnamed protein product [Vitrella brassicaformis CCMP3155]